MKRLIYIFVAGLLFLNFSYAQSDRELKGPAAKNYKPWKQQAKTGVAYTDIAKEDLKGPAFKNRKHVKDAPQEVVSVNTDLDRRKRITGPKAKNNQPYRRN
ncbi:hypothetical protein [Negadavirga shengliensis]|uniref:Uncharacterized protein n=1 Tax=Negadavirga shengliensis TaxID=1389218 RepID=A0ABV9T299_9BACT